MKTFQRRGVPVFLLALVLLLTGCGGTSSTQSSGGSESVQGADSSDSMAPSETGPSDAALQTAWQYIVSRIESDSCGAPIADVYVDGLEQVGRYRLHGEDIDTYALDFQLYREGTAETDPAEVESVYLFINSSDETPAVLGVSAAEDLPSTTDRVEALRELADKGEFLDFSKKSTTCTLLSEEEMESAIDAARLHYAEEGNNLMINIWYNEAKYSEELEIYRESSLYGMGEAAKSGNLIILYGDLVFSGDESTHLCRNWKMILKREDLSSPWELIDAGYG